MADAPETERGDTGDIMAPSLPQGEAQALNENAAEGQAAAGQIAANEQFQPLPVEFADEEPAGPVVPSGDDEFLYGPTDRPHEPITAGQSPGGYQKPPADVAAWLPLLREAAADPAAPATLRNMYRLIVHHMNEG